jgi:two-component system, LuxR family, sensor kinase FixL
VEQDLQASRVALFADIATATVHDINQPLAAIANYSAACERLLGQQDADLGVVRSALREIASQAQRAGESVRGLRRIASAGDLPRAAANINRLVAEVVMLGAAELHLHQIQMCFRPAAVLPAVHVNGGQIQQVLHDLLRNAVQALLEQPAGHRTIEVRTSLLSPQRVRVDVSDTGPGVAPDALPALFQPFRTTRAGSAGLGLAICRSIMRAHDGDLALLPDAPAGAHFVMTLPVCRR